MFKLKSWVVLSTLTVLAFSTVTYANKSRFEKIELFNKVLFLIESQYYREVDTEKLIQGALKGMMNTLDPHSSFLDKEVFEKMQEDTSGEFGGLGIEVTMKDGILIITTAIEDTPAYKAGLKSGDKIVEINNESMIGVTLDEAIQNMRGKSGSKINLGIVREGLDEIKHFVVVRKIIKIRSVKSDLILKNYIYIKYTQFRKDGSKNIIKAIKKERAKAKKYGGAKGIILDLRYNPGGLLDEAVNISSIFLKDGIVVSTEPRNPKEKEIKYVKKTGHKELDLPIVVLINGASASASEIVAGALQDHKRAIIAGAQSFGKGSVQTISRIDDEKGVKLTIAQYMTPHNRKIQAIGITPDVLIDDYDPRFLEENKILSNYIREADLKNHLTATIETKVEKKARIIKEKQDRKKRADRRKKMKAAKLKKTIKKKILPSEDFQVKQAVTIIQSLDIFKKLKK